VDELVPLETLEKRAIFRALQETSGDKLAAARLLGIGKTTLYRKLKQYESGRPQA
jgi:two-component system response regulator HydG